MTFFQRLRSRRVYKTNRKSERLPAFVSTLRTKTKNGQNPCSGWMCDIRQWGGDYRQLVRGGQFVQ